MRGWTWGRWGVGLIVIAAGVIALFQGPLPPEARADDPPNELGICGYKAYLIAVQTYDDERMNDLEGPANDIAAIGKVLERQYGFETTEVVDPTRDELLQLLADVRISAKACEGIILYFAGHGYYDEEPDVGYWVPSNAKKGSLYTYVSNDDVRNAIRALPARHVWLISDSCFSGTLYQSRDAGPPNQPREGEAVAMAEWASRPSRWITTSGDVERVSDTGCGGMSVFACELRDALKGAKKQYVTPDDIYPDLKSNVANNTVRRQTPRQGALELAGHKGGTFVLVNQKKSAVAVDPDSLARGEQRALPDLSGPRVALVIGNERYTESPELAEPVNDAKQVGETLTHLGFEVRLRLDLDQAAFTRELREFGVALRSADVGFFYYAGHAVQVGSQNYLAPIDASMTEPSDAELQAISVDNVMTAMNRAGAPLNVLAVDSCRNEVFGSTWPTGGTRGLVQLAAPAPASFVLAFATAPGGVAEDSGTYADVMGRNLRQPCLSVAEAFARTSREVTELTGGFQRPWINLTGDVGFHFYPAGCDTLPTRPGAAEPLDASDAEADKKQKKRKKKTKKP